MGVCTQGRSEVTYKSKKKHSFLNGLKKLLLGKPPKQMGDVERNAYLAERGRLKAQSYHQRAERKHQEKIAKQRQTEKVWDKRFANMRDGHDISGPKKPPHKIW